MAIEKTDWIFLNGEWKSWDDANVHVTTHALHYGSSVFEGIRAYSTDKGPAVFRLPEHVKRLRDSAKMMRMELDEYTQERLEQICLESVSRNSLDSCYIRPVIFRGGGTLGLNPLDTPVEVMSFAVEWGRYLGDDAMENGVDVMISSWRRFDAGTAAPLGKIGGQYVTSQFVSIEARQNVSLKAFFSTNTATSPRGRARTSSWSWARRSSLRGSRHPFSLASRATPSSRWRATWGTP